MMKLNRRRKFLIGLGGLVGFLLVLLVGFRIAFVNFIDNYELGYKFDVRTGKVEKLERTGYIINPPLLVKVHTIDLRPGQVCMNANARVLNCKLVCFDPDGFEQFIEWHGRGAGSGSSATTGGIYEILKSYAFNVNEGKDCPFLIILDDMRRKDVAEVTPDSASVGQR